MEKLKCWKKVNDGKGGGAITWTNGYPNNLDAPMIDIRKISKDNNLQSVSIYGLRDNGKVFEKRNDAVKFAQKIMQKHNKCY